MIVIKKAKVFALAIIIIVMVFLLVACAGPNEAVKTATESGHIAGFWSGLWEGLISPIAFVISLFNENVSIYEVHNTGHLYDLGFILGIIILFGGGVTTSSS